jgi:hypothetical protein
MAARQRGPRLVPRDVRRSLPADSDTLAHRPTIAPGRRPSQSSLAGRVCNLIYGRRRTLIARRSSMAW